MSDAASGSIDDHALKSKRGWIDVPIGAMAVIGDGSSLGEGTNAIADNGVAASELIGLMFTTADEVYGRFHPPWEADLSRDIMAQLFVIIDEANKANIDFTLHAKGVKDGEAESDAKSSADGNIVFPALSNVLAGELAKTPIMGLGCPDVFTLDDWIQFAVTCADIGTATADHVHLVKARFHFTVALTDASGVRQLT